MTQALVMEAPRKLNYFPPKQGVSATFTPRMILHRKSLDYKRHCSIPIFSYVQATDSPNPKNNQRPRTLDCIYLRPLTNAQGGHELLHLATNRVITRVKEQIVPVPCPDSIIQAVHALAAKEGMPKGLKIQTKHGHMLYDSAWTAGVEEQQDKLNKGKGKGVLVSGKTLRDT